VIGANIVDNAGRIPDAVKVIVDDDRVRGNIQRCHGIAERAGVRLRAHVKGHRTAEVAALQLAAGAVGVAVGHAREAAFYAEAGAESIVVAYPWPEAEDWRLAGFARLARDISLIVHVGRAEDARALDRAAAAAGAHLDVRIDVRTMPNRPTPRTADIVALAQTIDGLGRLRLEGISRYYGVEDDAEALRWRQALREHAELLVATAEAVRSRGIACETVCLGGTPALLAAADVTGITEVCSGAYAFGDAGMAYLGVCGSDDIAIWTSAAADARALAGEAAYPWTMPDDGVIGTADRWHPNHVCAVMQSIKSLTLVRGGEWEVRLLRDVPEAVG
jgi:D-serine deaminase-like pyridoxal phosphate-dependent protein